MKFTITLFTLFLLAAQDTALPEYINPQGTYVLGGDKKEDDHGDVYGYNGEITVKTLSHDSIAMSFFICKGAPSYNMGTFEDTLAYKNSQAIYFDPENNCKTTFTFTKKSVIVDEAENTQSCWGYGVTAHGEFLKLTDEVISLIEELTKDQ